MTITAAEVSESLAGAIASAAPSIVRVDGRGHLPSTGIVWSPDGVIVTAAHTLRLDDGIEVRFDDGSSSAASLAGRDVATDIAVLRTERRDARPARWRESAGLRVGHIVLAAGRPGRTVRATSGIVSAIGPEWRTADGTRVDAFIEVDASLPPGFSGGPLLDASGSLIGMNTSHVIRTGTTIPHATLARTVEALLAHGTIERRSLGVAIHPVEAGLLILSISAGSAAEKAGLMVGDIIRTRSPRELHERVQEAGETLELEIQRGGVEKKVTVSF